MKVVGRPLRPQAWHVAVIAAALFTVYAAIDQMYRMRAERTALLTVDAAMYALKSRIEALGPVRKTSTGMMAGATPLLHNDVVRTLHDRLHIDATIYDGDVRIATSTRPGDRHFDGVGTRAPPEIRAQVLEQGGKYRGLAQSMQRTWMVIRYEPLRNASGERVGMVSTWIAYDDLTKGIAAFRFLVGGTLLILFSVVSSLWIAAGRFATQVQRQHRAIEERNHQLEEAADLQQRREKELEAAHAEAERQRLSAEAANRAKSLFLANMSHELRTPLNAIIGYGEMLHEECVDEETERDLDRIVKASRHLLAIISDILDVSKVEAGRMELDIVDFDLQALCRELVGSTRPLIKTNDNAFHARIDAHLTTMESDPTRVRQILYNLLSNAAKFTKKGKVELLVESTTTIHGPGVRFVVSDTGIGMSDKQLSRVFHAFVQADASHTRQYGGTGLGLTIVRLLTERLDGRVSVQSGVGEGSTFVVELPLRMSELRRSLERPTVVPA